ncbi:MAG TPA: tetratricopeptide repeat protein [Nitrospiria bacterium]|nr:tetratricopeptide repeat protein [Nitrospiria bacterium]
MMSTLRDRPGPDRFVVVGAVFLVLLGGVIYGTQRQLERLGAFQPSAQTFRFLPKGDDLKLVSLGYDQLIADLLWLKAIQVMGDRGAERRDAEYLYQAFDAITTLDPKFDYVYQLGGVFLGVLSGRADLAVQLLAKGVRNNPDLWRLPFYLGFNEFYFLGRYKEAAAAMAKAASLPGHPEYLPFLASRLYAEAREPALALEFLGRMYEESNDQQVRAQLQVRMKEVMIERDVEQLNHAVAQFTMRYHRLPKALTELVTTGIVLALPTEPLGGRYYIDPSDHQVKSSSRPEGLHVKLPEQQLGPPQHHP